MRTGILLGVFLFAVSLDGAPPNRVTPVSPLVRVADLDVGEEARVTLHDGSVARVKVLKVEEHHESVTHTLAWAVVTVEVNGERGELVSGNYRLPVMVGGVQVDAPAVRAYMKDSHVDWWGLVKDARIRLWPAGSPWIEPGTFAYPVKQRWFASMTWYSNEVVSREANGKVYYHAGMDLGGAEGMIEVVAATDGVVLNLGTQAAPGAPHPAAQPRYDVIYLEDNRGWIYRYAHLMTFDPALRPGGRVQRGQRLGYLGKEGASGGWTHLHFTAESLQPSGKWGIQDSYAFLWQAYREQYDPPVLAVARPHQFALVGETVTLDASRSWARIGALSYAWTFTDGTVAAGPTVRRAYDRPGIYSEIVKATDTAGNIDYDFARVQVYTGAAPNGTASIVDVHASYSPTFGIRPGDPVVFRSRAFETPAGADVFDFGDGTPTVSVPSNIDTDERAAAGYSMLVHHFQKPGHYLVRVERREKDTGWVAMQHLHVVVEP